MGKVGGVGRHDVSRVPEPVGGYAALPTSQHNLPGQIAPVAAVDVYDAQRRVRALARIDLLDRERRSGAIDEASYLIGREVERVFEHMSHIEGGGQWFEGDRIDGATSAELKTLLGLERAYMVNTFLGWLVRHIGRSDTRLLWIVLGNRLSFSVAAFAIWHHEGVRGYRYAIDRFRDALHTLAEVKAAKGRALR
jgi:hypothetical protein